MAKSKGGLGRGLNSLLGGVGIETSNEVPGRQRVEMESRESQQVEEPPAPAPSSEVSEEDFLNEDRITIKSVTAREVSDKPVIEHIQVEEEPRETIHTRREVDVPGTSDREVDIEKVVPNPDQPRTSFKKEELEELAESIKSNGLLQPVLVRPAAGGTYQIIAGERRYQASLLLGASKLPIRIKEADDDKALELALIENIQRSDLNPIEEAYGYRRMMEHGSLTQSEVAQAVSKGRSTIANALRLLELPEDAQQLLFEEKITAGHARAILSVPDEEGRRKLTEKLVAEKLSVRETEALARLMSGKKESSTATRVPVPKSFKRVARSLRNSLHTNVRVKTVKGKNKIEIEFKDEEDLERLFKELSNQNHSA